MPIHDWTRISPGGYHTFHQNWTIEIFRSLNRGLLPPGYTAFTDLRTMEYEPDVVTIRGDVSPPPGGVAVAVAPPQAQRVYRTETDSSAYARKANRISVRHEYGHVVAVIEVVSPGNKDSRHAILAFRTKAVDFLRRGVSLLLIDPFPPTPRDPNGLPRLIWEELTDVPFDPPPSDKPLSVASFDPGDELTAYINPVAVGDPLPDSPLFLASGWYINVPLEQTYTATWAETPQLIRDLVLPPAG